MPVPVLKGHHRIFASIAYKQITPFCCLFCFSTMETFTTETSQSNEAQLKGERKPFIIPGLPKENGWLSSDDHPLYYYQGFWYYGHYIKAVSRIQELPDFNPSPSDIIISSNPKCGTTWLKALSFAIAKRSCFVDHPEDNPLLTTIPHNLIPQIEIDVAQLHRPRDPNLPLFATHLPYTFLPNSILSSGCRIVYISRDPKDAFISRWHFACKTRANKDVTDPIHLEEAFDLFCHGISPYGPYWNHVLEYWKAYLDHPDKILFLKYEDMTSDAESHVKKLAEFMQFPFSIEEERGGVVARIVEMCSFKSLSNLQVSKSGTFASVGSSSIPRDAFYRKGKVGDWKNYLTEEMANKIDQITMEKFGNSGLKF